MATINGTFNSLIAGTLSGTIGTPGPTGQTGPQGPAGPTFTGGPITSPITYDAGTNSTAFENGDIFAQDNVSGSYGAIYTGGLQASNGDLTIDITGAGITFGDSTVQSTAFPGSAAFYPATGNPSAFLTASALTGYATESFVTSQGYIGDAPSDGSQYARQDGAWEIVTGGGGGSYLPLAGGTMTGAIIFDGTSGQYISKGNFDTSRGGNYGISLVCSIGYEFNWQAGWLTTTNQGSVTPRPLYLDSLAGTTLRSWNSETDTGTEVAHTGINVGNTSPYYVNVAPDLVKVYEATNELGVSIAHDSIAIQHIDTPNQTSYFTNEYIGFEDMSGTPHSAWIEHDVITVQDATDTTQMRSTGISLSAGGSITFGDATTQTTAGLTDAPSDGSTYGRQDGAWVVAGGGGGSPGLFGSAISVTTTNGQVIAGTGNVITVYDLAPDAGSSWVWLAELSMSGANGSEATIFNKTGYSLYIPGCNNAIANDGVAKVIYSPSFASIGSFYFDKVVLGSSIGGPYQGELLRHNENIINTGVFATDSNEVKGNNYYDVRAGQPPWPPGSLFATYTTYPDEGQDITYGGPYPAPPVDEVDKWYHVSADGSGGYNIDTSNEP
jgi:hypothetical protein